MFTKKLLSILTIVMFILSCTMAYAHEKNMDAAAFFFLKKAAIDLSQLIEGVEKAEKGQVISFKIESEEDKPLQYEMNILRDRKIFEAKVEPKSGKVLKIESDGFFSRFSDDVRKNPSTTKFSLKDAITIVEKHYEGRALGGAFQGSSGMEMFRIRVANNEGAFTVMVDANTGELFRVSSRDGRHDTDEEFDE